MPITVFLSGGGRSLANLMSANDRGDLHLDFRCVISSSGKVRGVEIAREAGIQTRIITKKSHLRCSSHVATMEQPWW